MKSNQTKNIIHKIKSFHGETRILPDMSEEIDNIEILNTIEMRRVLPIEDLRIVGLKKDGVCVYITYIPDTQKKLLNNKNIIRFIKFFEESLSFIDKCHVERISNYICLTVTRRTDINGPEC